MRCHVCAKENLKEFFSLTEVPIFCNVLWPRRAQALAAPRADIRLGFCRKCGYIYNLAFDPSVVKYTHEYRNPLHFSMTFRQYIEELTSQLIERYELQGKNVIEIGCGDGYFLGKLCQTGGNRGVGFDPAHDSSDSALSAGLHFTILSEEYSRAHADYPVDFICCRQVLEHVCRPLEFLVEMRETIGNRCDTGVFFEVPNALYSLEQLGIWDVIYEHCSYFVPTALEVAFRRAGFEPVGTAQTYGGQFLSMEAFPSVEGHNCEPPSTWAKVSGRQLIERFAEAYRRKADSWRRRLRDIRRQGVRAVVWGSGSKGVSFLNVLGIDEDTVAYVVDIDTHKCGRFVPGTGQQVVAPGFLKQYRPEVIIIMNPIYQKEIEDLVKLMSLDALLLVA